MTKVTHLKATHLLIIYLAPLNVQTPTKAHSLNILTSAALGLDYKLLHTKLISYSQFSAALNEDHQVMPMLLVQDLIHCHYIQAQDVRGHDLSQILQ